MRKHKKRNVCIVISSVILYGILYVFINITAGKGEPTVSFVPVMITALLYGFRAGIAAGILIIPVDFIIGFMLGTDIVGQMLGGGGLAGMVAVICIGAIVGKMRDLSIALRKSEESFRAIAESTPDAVVTVDEENSIIYWNKSAESMFGYTTDEVTGKNATILLPARYRQDSEASFAVTSQSGRKLTRNRYEAVGLKKSGDEFQVEHSMSTWTAGDRFYITSIIRDITDRKKAEQEKETLISDLQSALAKVKKLSGLLPICACCKKIRDDRGYWNQIENYIHEHSEADFSHSICPECFKKQYPGEWEKINRELNGTRPE